MPSDDSTSIPEPSERSVEPRRLSASSKGSIALAAGVEQYELARPERIVAVRRAADKAYLSTILSGGVYGVGSVWVVGLFATPRVGTTPSFMVAVLLFSFIGMVLGFIIAFFTTSFAHFCVLTFNWMMGGVLTRRTAVVMIGAIAGYVPTCLFIVNYLLVLGTDTGLRIGELLICLLPVVSAMLVGQMGGVIGAANGGTWQNLEHELLFNADRKKAAFQFKIGHLLKGMIWISGILALDQLCPNHEVLIAVTVLAVLLPMTWGLDFLYSCGYQKKLVNIDQTGTR